MTGAVKAGLVCILGAGLLVGTGLSGPAKSIPFPNAKPNLEGYEGDPAAIEQAIIAESLVHIQRDASDLVYSPLSIAYIVTPKLLTAIVNRIEAGGDLGEETPEALYRRWMSLAWDHYTWILFELMAPEPHLVEVGPDRYVYRVILEDSAGLRYDAVNVSTLREPVFRESLDGWVAQYSAFFPVSLQNLAAGDMRRLRLYISSAQERSVFEFSFATPEPQVEGES